MSLADSRLFYPLKVGNVDLQHRVVLAPLTRFRADDDHVPMPITVDYYAQRACVPGTLLITEATYVSKRGGGMPNVPGIWNKKQIAAWRNITDAVHKQKSFIFMQLWALGRVAVPQIARDEGFDIVSSSPVPEANPMSPEIVTPRELTVYEIKQFIGDFVQAAKNAMEAGFDGVEIHGAGGYLIDQFTQDTCNRRNDEYGGSIENRSRFLLEVAGGVADAIGAEKVGVRLSPWQSYQGMGMKEPISQFTHVICRLKELKLAYLHLIEARVNGTEDVDKHDSNTPFIEAWGKISPVILAGGYTPSSASERLDRQDKEKDLLIAFGRHFIPNPDLAYRVKNGIPFAPYDRSLFYMPKSERGLADYSFSAEFIQENENRSSAN
ncbi:hypothetical protein ASPBRDRAFT_40213 [Aspergillus brasiliensis CBS 101740]|uniref:NADH:flavin oxidoreductase/NADH oxidase N-terminal domain-containing protein n=1 Tax=Aspergillus brasiliensis (strain CBS 101740 / IMI 381727 / IBT 21946) TaxID=767769 RepID=A0A1L9UTR6_ASPBC|nr:hypothetical protein ASPBRDRAFT_40213 [Aspergillus brasiliensis CBS 101740]